MKKLVILGAGESGVGTAMLAKQQGYDVFVSDMGSIKPRYKKKLEECGVRWEEGQHTEKEILSATEVVKSPGIPDTAPIVKALIAKGTPILAELEFAKRYSKGKTICITGSNGKTTTTSLIYYIMKKWGVDVGLAGNIGKSYAMQVATKDRDWYVLEISSFQLDNMFTFHADVAVLMNITPDHLDRYDFNMQNYVDSKMRIIQNQTPKDSFVYWVEDEYIDKELQKRLDGYAPKPTPSSRPAVMGNPSLVPFSDKEIDPNSDFPLPGKHNQRNMMAACAAVRAAMAKMDLAMGQQCKMEDILTQCLKDFPGVEHRLEKVIEKDGILWINDSKATNVDACHVALEAMSRPTVLIVGGKDKGNDYNDIKALVKEKCCALVYMGVDNAKLHASFDDLGLPVADTHSMKECVEACRKLAKKGDVVLLSPCCASFDLFKNMEDRGEQFKTLAKE
ncbi:MAG: UDP-N-acetylmuramoyl-L-alanine--D-glutamate ligase [Prevotella sp.]|jgi:UDP-N-acetylmuramoylalanine--D-glutamate ligase|nr:UDP-N-acetylmuramoyl-L-alanine--D-glutamate ligase [Prevotella sp.]MBQ2535148.1 UDP-N-acetylmuramoyl-L-alanine--D-glutamate ligase [Prevotella sp.]MBQ4041787.1 UDP-N-acetylmuramoyl-L-alanine--D-glutamate ligase [Prevotella sp.]